MIAAFLLGSAKITFSESFAPEAFRQISEKEIPFTSSQVRDGECTLNIPLYRLRQLDFPKESVKTEICGFPKLLVKYRRRWGIAVGALLFSLILYFSGTVIWTVDITGNSNISDEYIKSVLKKVGCSEGVRIENLDFDVINNRFLIESEGIAWISVNMNGTHANAEVREIRRGAEQAPDGAMYNLVANEDGQIETVAATEGKPVVKINDAVSKGDILVSGVITHGESRLRFESADGSVYARVLRSFDVKIPLDCEKKTFTGEKKTYKTVTFFKNSINLFTNYGIPYGFYDTIEKEKRFHAGDYYLPLSVKTVTYAEYTPKKARLSKKEAEERLLSEYRKMLRQTLDDDNLLSKKITRNDTEKDLCLHCELYCLADIAEKREIKIN